MKRLFLVAYFILSWFGDVQAQYRVICINGITIEGNKKTREEVILRELLFKADDRIPDSLFNHQLEKSRQLIMNTNLFNEVKITLEEIETDFVEIHILVVETWYVYPVPIFELIDRNFNVWWVEQNRSLQRLNLGIEFIHLNFSGRNDKLKINAKYGYTRSYSLKYSLPFLNRAQTWGIFADISFNRKREVNYNSVNNKQLFHKDPDGNFIYQSFGADLGFVYRPGHHLRHNVRLRYQQNHIADIVANELNPDYFLNGRKCQRAFSLYYLFSYDFRDLHAYPVEGNLFTLEIKKEGLGILKERNGLTTNANYDHYFSLTPSWSTGFQFSSKLSLVRKQQAFNDYKAFGFGRNNLYGYEYYVVNGMDMALLKAFIRFRIIEKELKFGKLVPVKAFRKMPVSVYLNLNQGTGVLNDPFAGETNPFSNRMLYGGGLGIDVVMYHDMVFRLQYSYNHLWEHGLFLHFNTNI
ncbi:MAG: BamA/TamA family outer membrane protein [Bacteroidetes bacterium]|nr:BamA/TamA family outer membrane protein [Bacteroidota bacterium]